MNPEISSDPRPRHRARWRYRWVLAAALVLTALSPLAPVSGATLQTQSTWEDPNGGFTLAWSDPWYALRQEEHVIGLTDGTSIVTTGDSSPLPGVALTRCPEELAAFATDAPVDSASFIEKKISTWRAWATLEDVPSGQTHYFECQVTPDGKSVVYFVGGTQTPLAAQGIPALEAFARDATVKQQGETAPVLASNGWRVAIVEWSRGKAFGDIGLAPSNTGEDDAVLVVDVLNWQATTTELPIDAFQLEALDGTRTFPVDVERSNVVAASLGEAPLEPGVPISIQPGEALRITLVFAIDSSVGDLAFSNGDARISLKSDAGLEVFGALRPPAALPVFETGTVTNVIDGRTLLVALSDTGEVERVRLIGLSASQPDTADEFLATYIGQPVLLERDPAYSDERRLQRYVWVTDANGVPAMLNHLLIEGDLASHESTADNGRFDAMLGVAPGVAASAAGIADPILHAEERPVSPVAAELSDADRAYLAELMRSRDNYRLSLEYYDLFMSARVGDPAFSTHLFSMVLGWSVFYDGLDRLEPTPQFAKLHARYLAACEPFAILAHEIEPALDQILAGETPEQPFAGFDYDVMTSTVASARPALEQVLAEIDAVLAAAGIAPESGVPQ